MKSKKMIEMYDYDICNIKIKLDRIATYYQDKAMMLAIGYSASLEELQYKIRSNYHFSAKVFYYCAKTIDHADDLIQVEEILVFMNLVLGNTNKQYELYKDRLYHKIMKNIVDYLTSDEYLVLRHLRRFTKKNRRQYLNAISCKLRGMMTIQQQFFLEIYLIEEDYLMAWELISKGVHTPLLAYYSFELYENNPKYYQKYILKQPQKINKWQACFLEWRESMYGRKNNSGIKLYFK